ncbi:hypothetical protein D1AOALGA4SA_1074 [Olavius algarvensis Delta 1 endosymbiont]|nr:hypothetical protein D1AOALGA4SA_1074 [Olavius algarvensis Delta 1 endosymbiont]
MFLQSRNWTNQSYYTDYVLSHVTCYIFPPLSRLSSSKAAFRLPTSSSSVICLLSSDLCHLTSVV